MTTQNPMALGLDYMRQLGASQAQIQNTQDARQMAQLRQAQEQRAAQTFDTNQQTLQQQQEEAERKQFFDLLSNVQKSIPDPAMRFQAMQQSPFAQSEGFEQYITPETLTDEGIGMMLAASPYQATEEETGLNFGTVNPRDYTPQSLAKYQQTGNYEDLERYYPLKQTVIAGTTYFSDDQGNLFLPAQPGIASGQANGADAQPSQESTVMTPEEQAKADADRRAEIKRAEAEVESESSEAQEMRRLKELELQRTAELIDRLLQSKNLGKISGAETGVPLVGGAQAMFAQDELNDLKSLTNLLTMGNLGRMSGVLSESDIKLIANAASGIGMNNAGTPISEGRLREILSQIKSRLPSASPGQTQQSQPQDQADQPKVVNWSDMQ